MARDSEKLAESPWAVVLQRHRAASLGSLRHLRNIDILVRQESIWLQGSEWTEEVAHLLRQIPCDGRYRLLEDRRLLPMGKRLPTGRLPEGPWAPLAHFLVPRFQSAAFPGEMPAPCPVELIRSADEQPTVAMLTTLADWLAYGESAPGVRLRDLSFAIANDGRVLVLGQPPPSMPGTGYHATGRILMPAGYCCTLAIVPRLLSKTLRLRQDDRALLHADGTCEKLPGDAFVAASRSAIRLSCEGTHG